MNRLACSLLPLLLLLGACTRVDTVRLRPGSVVVPAGYEPLAAIHVSASSAYLLFIPIPGVSLEQVLDGKLFAAARALGADRVTDIAFHIDACQSPICLWKLLGYQEAWASGIAVRVVPQLSAPSPSPSPSPSAVPDAATVGDRGIIRLDDAHYEISRAALDAVLGDSDALGRGARVVPSIKDGQPNGFKVYAIRPGSVYTSLGLQNGDTIHSINGLDISSPDRALAVYVQVKDASTITVELTRRGQPVTMVYTVTSAAPATNPELEF